MGDSQQKVTFEWLEDDGKLEIHADREGLEALIGRLQGLLEQGDHLHLMTPAWGGDELGDSQQNPEGTLVHHVKVLLW